MSDKNDQHKSTPPSTHRKVRNPFDKVLIERLHKPICSPGMCKIYKQKSNGSFRWDIDQACTLVPKEIIACNSQFEPSPDPALEKIAEEATERFFSQEMVMASPMEMSKKNKPLMKASCEASVQISNVIQEKLVITKDVSAQTILTLPPELPPEIEKILQPFCTYTQDQTKLSDEYEVTANGSFRCKLFFEEHSDMEHYDSEQTDDEIHIQRPPSSYEAHTPVKFSSNLGRDQFLSSSSSQRQPVRNKILDVVDFGETCFSPIEFQTPIRNDQRSGPSSLTSVSISPVTKAVSSDEEKHFTSPESDGMFTCLECISEPRSGEKGPCFCKIASNKIKRSASLKESPPRSRKSSLSLSEKRSLSMSSLHRSRSVQKLDFSMDISIDDSHNQSQADSESSSHPDVQASWSIVEETSLQNMVKEESVKLQTNEIESSTKIHSINVNILDETPIKGKSESYRTHEISKIRVPVPSSPLNMSLDTSLEGSDNLLTMEHKKIDFNTVDLKFLTENVSQFDRTSNVKVNDCSTSFKRVDSGFNENTFYASTSYYESAIKPSELTVTNISKSTTNNALKEISNVHWMRVDSGFKDENSADSIQFYPNDNSVKKFQNFQFTEAKLADKENVATEEFDRFLVQSNKDTMSMSDIFTDDMTFNCNFSSTPSKNKSRRLHS